MAALHLPSRPEGLEALKFEVIGVHNHKGEVGLVHRALKSLQQARLIGLCRRPQIW